MIISVIPIAISPIYIPFISVPPNIKPKKGLNSSSLIKFLIMFIV